MSGAADRKSLNDATGRISAALTIFLGAFLLFAVEPLIAKMILPWFGGAAGVWIACLLFFQAALLAGYLYAHFLASRVPAARQWQLHAALLALSLLFLPIIPADGWKPGDISEPLLLILLLLAATIGLPFVLLAATSPLVQAWVSRRDAAPSVYRLYALSNAGSLLALLSYPILIEPFLPTRTQASIWSALYAGFAVICAAVAWKYRGANEPMPTRRERMKLTDRLLWLLLAAVPSALLLAATHHMLRNVAAIPLFWVVPLSLYLLSLIVCFDSPRWYYRPLWHGIFPAAVGTLILCIVAPFLFAGYATQLALYSVAFFICCMLCHGELAALKPSPQTLTSFYLTVAAGGAVGGLAVAAIAPFVSDYDNDLAITLLVLTGLVAFVVWRRPENVPSWVGMNSAFLVLAAWPALIALLAVPIGSANSQTLLAVRNFYGPLQVRVIPESGARPEILELQNGSIVHGRQFTAQDARCTPLSYFSPASGIGAAMGAMRGNAPLRFGGIGLGAGTIAAYARPGDGFRFYEINPLVRSIATSAFHYLTCAENSDVVMGDGRLSLEREAPQNFDVFAVDAFTSDAIPVHLLTREAFSLYWRHIRPGGVLAVHVSNTFVDLAPIVARAAAESGKTARLFTNNADFAKGISQSFWVLVADDPAFFTHQAFRDARPVEISGAERVWTDDYSNLWRAMKW
jgi:hypothetical protein